MKVLVCWPPEVPTYFNPGHRIFMYQVAAHLRLKGDAQVDTADFGLLNVTWKSVADRLLSQRYDVVVICNELDSFSATARLSEYCRRLRPSGKIVTVGRLSTVSTMPFEALPVDAIVASGDPEKGVLHAIKGLNGGADIAPGVSFRRNGLWTHSPIAGEIVPTQDWSWPDVGEIPYESYLWLSSDDLNRFCSIPDRAELVVPVARGCPVNCFFCDVPKREGLTDRRPSTDSVVGYIKSALESRSYDYVSMYAPTFTLRRNWVRELCQALIGEYGVKGLRWKCTTTIRHLDHTLLTHMAVAGCIRVSVGLETTEPTASENLHHIKRVGLSEVLSLNAACQSLGIELNCFVILDLPGNTAEGIRSLVSTLQGEGVRVRQTLLVPTSTYADVHGEHVANRQLGAGAAQPAFDYSVAYEILFGGVLKKSNIEDSIPTKSRQVTHA